LPRSVAAQLHVSESCFRESVKNDSKVPVVHRAWVIACNTSSSAGEVV